MVTTFHFLRPWWFVALLPVVLLLWRYRNQESSSNNWKQVIAPRLHPYVLSGHQGDVHRFGLVSVTGLLSLLSFFLIITALAGPVWKKQEQPVFQDSAALVIVLDLSRSMDAVDLTPSRLERVKLKLLDLMHAREDGQSAIVVYAAQPFILCPLTPDADTLGLQMKAVSTDMMPVQGSRPDRAIALAGEMLHKAGLPRGDILLVTDGIEENVAGQVEDQIRRFPQYRVSVLGVGTVKGAPIPGGSQEEAQLRYRQSVVDEMKSIPQNDVSESAIESSSGFLVDNKGQIVIARLDEASLRNVAKEGKGGYHRLSTDGSDFRALLASMEQDLSLKEDEQQQVAVDRWYEEGVWLLLPVLPLLLLLFRRGVLLLIVLGIVGALGCPGPWQTGEARAGQHLWLNRNQQAARLLSTDQEEHTATDVAPTESKQLTKNAEQAAELFTDPRWKAAARYEAGQYEQALESLQGDDLQTLYNKGNALAKMGRLGEALEAWGKVLEQEPENADAKKNYQLVELVKKQLEQQQQDQQKEKGQDGQNQHKESEEGSGNPQNGQKDNEQNGSGSSDSQQNSNQEMPQSQEHSQKKKSNQGKQDNNTMRTDPAQQQEEQQQKTGQQGEQPEQAAAQAKAAQADNNAREQGEKQQGVLEQLQEGDQEGRKEKQGVPIDPRLQVIPDDPGGLWRRKFLFQYQREYQQQQGEEQQW
nr:VWA domain-containing protein [uncultured Desulfobulbus sp.]